MNNKEVAARLTVIERAIVNLAVLVEQLRQDTLDAARVDMVECSHDDTKPETVD